MPRRARSCFRPTLETLEDRRMPAAHTLLSATLQANGVLVVNGSPKNDLIYLRQISDQVSVYDGVARVMVPIKLPHGKPALSVRDEQLAAIIVNAGRGDNNVLAGYHTAGTPLYDFRGRVLVEGGPGDDTLINYAYSNCLLSGGGGVDVFRDYSPSFSTQYEEPYNPSTPALPGPVPGGPSAGDPSPAAAYTDLVQGANDTCTFLAALSSLALTDHDLASRITYDPGLRDYTVDLYAQDAGQATRTPVRVSFNGTWGNKDAWEPQSGEFWTVLYQRAYLSLMAQEGLNYHDGQNAWFALTGQQPDHHAGPFTTADAQTIQLALATGGNATVATGGSSAAPLPMTFYQLPDGPMTTVSRPMVANHTYTVVAMTPTAGGDFQVTLRNPWGRAPGQGEFTAPWSAVAPWLTDSYVNAVTLLTDSRGGLYAVNLHSGSSTRLGDAGRPLFDIALSPSGQLYGLDGADTLYTIDLAHGGQATEVGPLVDEGTGQAITADANALEFRRDGTLYVAAGGSLYRLNPQTAQVQLLLTLPGGEQSAGDLVFDPQGDLFLTTQDGSLVEADPSLGSATNVGQAGALGMDDVFGLVWSNGTLYGFSNSQEAIYQIDPATAQVTTVANLNGAGVMPDGIYGATMLPR